MSPSNGGKASSKDVKEASLKAFLTKLRKRRILKILKASEIRPDESWRGTAIPISYLNNLSNKILTTS